MKWFWIPVILSALMLPGAQARDGDPLPRDISVTTAIELALERNPAFRQSREAVNERRGERRQAFGIDRPRLFYGEEGIPSGGSDFTERRWGVSQALDFPLTGLFRHQARSAEIGMLEAEVATSRQHLVAAVKQAYADVAHAARLLALREEMVTISQEFRDAAQARLELGEAAELEMLNAEVQLAEALNDLAAAQVDFDEARYTLFELMGVDEEEQDYDVDFPDTLRYVPSDIRQDSILAHLKTMPAYRSAGSALDAARWDVRAGWSGLLPGLDMSWFQQDFGTGYDAWGFEVGISVPLWLPLGETGRIQKARARYRSAREGMYARELALKKAAESAWHRYEASRETIDRYHRTTREQSRRLLQLTAEGYRLGELDVLRLLVAQRTYLSSQERYYGALREYTHQLILLEPYLGRALVFN